MSSEEIIEEALAAIEARDWTRLVGLLHPDVHWRDEAGEARGPKRVIVHLSWWGREAQPPEICELREGKICRWG